MAFKVTQLKPEMFKGYKIFFRKFDNKVEAYTKETHPIDDPEFVWGIGKTKEDAFKEAKQHMAVAHEAYLSGRLAYMEE